MCQSQKQDNRETVLYSLVGSSDPVRDNYDGPMLHIVRNLRPKRVYLSLTKAMEARDSLDDRYVKAILSVDETIEVKKFHNQVENVHYFDAFFSIIDTEIKAIRADYEGKPVKILVNVTSGTPQYIAAAALYLTGVGTDLIPIQVPTHQNDTNDSDIVKYAPYDVNGEVLVNIDGDENSNRIMTPDLLYFQRANMAATIEGLVRNYEYNSAKQILNKDIFSNYGTLVELLNYAISLMSLDWSKAGDYLSTKEHRRQLTFTPQNEFYGNLLNYFLLMRIKFEKQDFNGFLLMLDPFFSELQLNYIIRKLGLPKRDFSRGRRIDGATLRERHRAIADFVDEKLGNTGRQERVIFINTRYLLCIIQYFAKENPAISKDLEVFEKYDLLKEQRNEAAHALSVLLWQDISGILGGSIKGYMEEMEGIILDVFRNEAKHKHLYLFQTLNDLLVKELQTL